MLWCALHEYALLGVCCCVSLWRLLAWFGAHVMLMWGWTYLCLYLRIVYPLYASLWSGPNTYNESENVSKFEIMDGAPVRGESIPVRLFLAPYELTPTMKNVHNKFSVKYYLNLVLVDEEDRRFVLPFGVFFSSFLCISAIVGVSDWLRTRLTGYARV